MSRLLSLVLLFVPGFASAAPPVTAVAFEPKGDKVAFAFNGEVRMFDVQSGASCDRVPNIAGRITALAYDSRNEWLAIAHGDAGKSGLLTLVRTDLRGAKRTATLTTITAHKDAIYALAFSPDRKTIATAGYDRVIHLWDVPQNEKLANEPRLTLKDHSDAVYGLAFHPDGKLLASVSADRAVKIWEAATGKRLHTLSDATDWLYAVAWSPDKKHLAAAGADKSVRVWQVDAQNNKLVHAAFAHEKAVWRLAYSANGDLLYSLGEDKIVKSWNTAKFAEMKVYDAQPDNILDFALLNSGDQFALAGFDGTSVTVSTATGKMIHKLIPLDAQKGKAPPNFAFAQPAEPKQPAKPMPPKAEKFTPASGIRGKTVRVTFAGQHLNTVKTIVANVPDVKVTIDAKKQTATALEADVSIPANAAAGAVQFTLEGEGGKSSPIAFAVDHFAAVNEVGITDSARNAMAIPQNTTVVGTIDRAGDMDYFRFAAAVGDPIGVQIVASELGSKLDAVLVLTDETGNIIAEGNASLGFVVRNAGNYSVGVRDRDFRGGADFAYRLHVGRVPVVTGVFPLAAQRGRTTTVHVTGVNLGSPQGIIAKVTIPATATIGDKFAVPLPANSATASGKAEVTIAEFGAVVFDPVVGADIRVPGSADGIFTKPGEAHTAKFNAKKGERLIVEVLARRAGSPVDPVIEILDASGKPVPFGVLRATAKTSVTFRDHDSVNTGIRLDAWNELAIDNYLYVNGEVVRILALPKGPDDDCQFYQTAGQRTAFFGTTPIHHSFGESMYKVELHPPGATFPPNGLPQFALTYRNDDGGPGYGKDSRLFFDAPTEGTYQVRVTDARGSSGPNHAFRVTVRAPKPDFAVTFSPNAPSVWKGGALPINVTITRFDAFAGRVDVKLEGLPPGFSAPETFIESGFNTTTFALSTDATATVPANAKFKLIARAKIGDKDVTREATSGLPKVVAVGDIVTTLNVQSITIEPGKETRFTVDIARQGKFAGRVPIEVKGLPHGVRVLNIGLNGILITERDTSREVVLYAEPWVKPLEHPIVVLARREGLNTEHAAKSLLLKVK